MGPGTQPTIAYCQLCGRKGHLHPEDLAPCPRCDVLACASCRPPGDVCRFCLADEVMADLRAEARQAMGEPPVRTRRRNPIARPRQPARVARGGLTLVGRPTTTTPGPPEPRATGGPARPRTNGPLVLRLHPTSHVSPVLVWHGARRRRHLRTIVLALGLIAGALVLAYAVGRVMAGGLPENASVDRPMTPPSSGRTVAASAPIPGAGERRHCPMGKYMDVHDGFFGVTAEQLREAHDRDLAIERDEEVHFERAWLDPDAGKVFCLATGPSKEAVMRIHERAGHPTPNVYELTVEV